MWLEQKSEILEPMENAPDVRGAFLEAAPGLEYARADRLSRRDEAVDDMP
jgi:hypothetical protein